MGYSRILTVQDISCLGQCSMTVALPILSACGHETCVLPTMVLSTHTGGLGTPHRRDLTADLLPVAEHWRSLGIRFDSILVGYLGKAEQVRLVAALAEELLAPQGKLIVDPAMADHGRLYGGITPDCVAEMKTLLSKADVILPNGTEGCLLADLPMDAPAEDIACRLEERYGTSVLLTGIGSRAGETGFLLRKAGQTVRYSRPLVGGVYHGTGDMFAAVFTGALMQGWNEADAAVLAAEYVAQVAENTCSNPAHPYGTKFETALPWLISQLQNGLGLEKTI